MIKGKPNKRGVGGKGGAAEFTITHPRAAGIDIGSASHFVAVPPESTDESVREFASFTSDLNELADWLRTCGVDTVAMESTGVYWIPLYELLEARGFKVMLVNARHVKGVPGRKSDVIDCQWLQQLMTYGLLRGSFRPPEQVCILRSLWRQRGMLLKSQSRHIQHMQKALMQMNIQLANVIADVAGETGLKILRAIAGGERDPRILARMKNSRIRAGENEIAKSLEGNWRSEHLFALKQALDAFDFVGRQIFECDREIASQLERLHIRDDEPERGRKLCRTRNSPNFDLRTHLFKVCGVDLTRINGINVTTALAVISEVGADMSRFATVKHFTSWLGLCPGTKITGGKVISSKTKPCANRAAQALRLAAVSLYKSKSAMGAYFRRLCSRMDKPKAITAAAHKLARLIYTMLTKGEEYTDQGQQYYEQRYTDNILRQMIKRAEKLGMKLVPDENAASINPFLSTICKSVS